MCVCVNGGVRLGRALGYTPHLTPGTARYAVVSGELGSAATWPVALSSRPSTIIPMQITPEDDDAKDFIAVVERIVDGLLRRDKPSSLALIKIDNWFGSNWLQFSGTVMGAFGVANSNLTVPPFVPNRVVLQRRFAAPLYDEVDSGELLHLDIPSSVAMTRRVSDIAPATSLVWYSGNSQSSGQGCIMAYVPEGDAYWSWYAAWANRGAWHIVKAIGVRPQDLLNLMEPSKSRQLDGESD